MSNLFLCSEICNRLREYNADDKHSFRLLTSDIIFRKHMANIAKSAEHLEELLSVLADAHYLFRFKIVEPDEVRQVPGIYGYLMAELPLIGELRIWADAYLEASYEQQFYRRKQAMPILRELIPEARRFNSTELGRGLNVASMLLQYEKVMIESFGEFTDGWKWKALKSGLLSAGLSSEDEIAEYEAGGPEPHKRFGHDGAPSAAGPVPTASPAPSAPFNGEMPGQAPAPAEPANQMAPAEPPPGIDPQRRAVDMAELDQLQAMNLSGGWGKAVQRYGVPFLIRVHLRKYEFEVLRNLIRTGRIVREDDLRFLRDSLRKMQGRLEQDPPLKRHVQDMAELRRMAQVRLNRIYEVKRRVMPGEVYTHTARH